MIAIDLVGPLERSSNGNRYLLMIKDCFSRWLEAIPTNNISAENIALMLESDTAYLLWEDPQLSWLEACPAALKVAGSNPADGGYGKSLASAWAVFNYSITGGVAPSIGVNGVMGFGEANPVFVGIKIYGGCGYKLDLRVGL